jgi:hypothetical protein
MGPGCNFDRLTRERLTRERLTRERLTREQVPHKEQPMTPFETVLPAIFHSSINAVPCTLDLRLQQGSLVGVFNADGEELEVYGGLPNAAGEVFGFLRLTQLDWPLAVFRAWLTDTSTLEVEVDLPGGHDLMAFERAERIVFVSALEVTQNKISLRRTTRSGLRKLERI